MITLIDNVAVAKNAPFISGPGAVKSAIIAFMGGTGYPTEGEFKGGSNRSVSIIGNSDTSMGKWYCWRESVAREGNLAKMDMTHYKAQPPGTNGKATQSCTVEIFTSKDVDKS